ncbi:RAD51-associated protein 1 [Clarias gariepinus]|uniref:RAD51-associated protein 1 n=1 Tax=Clarias gariepinus TaxID=13013 RepID=UPI00234CAED5|nr:RAD51-associated protein 1 [Clarias gariepinus]
MERPSRNKKSINYSDFMDNDDEDFATVKAPPNKKARASVKECSQDKTRKDEIIDSTAKSRKERVSLDDKVYQRDLETALMLSQIPSTEKPEAVLSNCQEKSESCEDIPPVLTHFSVDGSSLDNENLSIHPPEDLPPVLSNCSVDITCLGLDQIAIEQTKKKPQRAAEQKKCAFQDAKENDDDEDYRPQNTPESDSDFSDPGESEDEEYTVKTKRDKKKTTKNEKKTSSKDVKKDKKPAKPAKSKPQSKVKNTALSSPGVRSPAATKPLSTLNRTPTTPPLNKSALHTSPSGGRMPKWTPPARVGRSPGSCQSPPVKSPGLGLRLGLSRLARVKPLHPNTVAH